MKRSFFSSTPCSKSADGAFTLLELLVVITIIGILAGLLLPVISKVTENARKVSAKSTETQVVAAINNYQTDYGTYPVVTPAAAAVATDTTFGYSDGHNYLLFNALRAIKLGTDPAQDALNARQIVYYEGKNVKSSSVPKDGFVLAKGGKSTAKSLPFEVGDLVDPWGNSYMVRVDTDYNNVLENPYTSEDDGTTANPSTTDGTVLRLGAICYSFGLDGGPGDAKNSMPPTGPTYTNIYDDVVSWQ